MYVRHIKFFLLKFMKNKKLKAIPLACFKIRKIISFKYVALNNLIFTIYKKPIINHTLTSLFPEAEVSMSISREQDFPGK